MPTTRRYLVLNKTILKKIMTMLDLDCSFTQKEVQNLFVCQSSLVFLVIQS